MNNIVENNAWYNITEVNQEQTITKLLHTVEEATLSISKNYKTATEVEVNTSNLGKNTYSKCSYKQIIELLEYLIYVPHITCLTV